MEFSQGACCRYRPPSDIAGDLGRIRPGVPPRIRFSILAVSGRRVAQQELWSAGRNRSREVKSNAAGAATRVSGLWWCKYYCVLGFPKGELLRLPHTAGSHPCRRAVGGGRGLLGRLVRSVIVLNDQLCASWRVLGPSACQLHCFTSGRQSSGGAEG